MPSMPAVLLAILLGSAAVFAQSEAGYRANIGKTAFNAQNNVEIGRIVDVGQISGVWVYKVNRAGRIINAPVDNVVARSVPSKAAQDPAPLDTAARIDPALHSTATEFRGRLAQYGGTLQRLTIASDTLTAAWTSSKCDMVEGEVIHLLLSINRTHKESPAISASRRCGGNTRTFSLSSSAFQQHRSGKLSDRAVLKGIK